MSGRLTISGPEAQRRAFVEHYLDSDFSNHVSEDGFAAFLLDNHIGHRDSATGPVFIDLAPECSPSTTIFTSLAERFPGLKIIFDFHDRVSGEGCRVIVRPSDSGDLDVIEDHDPDAAAYRCDHRPLPWFDGGRLEVEYLDPDRTRIVVPAASGWGEAKSRAKRQPAWSHDLEDAGIRAIRNLTTSMTLDDWMTMPGVDKPLFLGCTGSKLLERVDWPAWIAADPDGTWIARRVEEEASRFNSDQVDRMRALLAESHMLELEPAMAEGPSGSPSL